MKGFMIFLIVINIESALAGINVECQRFLNDVFQKSKSIKDIGSHGKKSTWQMKVYDDGTTESKVTVALLPGGFEKYVDDSVFAIAMQFERLESTGGGPGDEFPFPYVTVHDVFNGFFGERYVTYNEMKWNLN